MYRLTRLFPSIILISILSNILYAEDIPRPTRVAVVAVPVLKPSQDAIGKVIEDSSALELRLAEFQVSIIKDDADISDLSDRDYLVRSEYQIVGSDIIVNIQAIDIRSNSLVSSGLWEGELSLNLDDEIQAAVRKDIVPALPPTIPVSRRIAQEAADQGEKWAVDALVGSESHNSTDSAGIASSNTSGDEELRGRWTVGLGGSAYIPLSETATYAMLGYGGGLNFGYIFPAGSTDIAIRIIVESLFLPTESSPPTDILMTPGGLDLKFSSGEILIPYIRVGGGVTWLMILPEGGTPQGKLIPYANAGLGMDFMLGNTFAVGIDVAFSTQFEGSLVLFGISPGVGMSFRL